jgi:hypothetical protein
MQTQSLILYTISYTSATDLTSFVKLMSWFIESRVTEETCKSVSS